MKCLLMTSALLFGLVGLTGCPADDHGDDHACRPTPIATRASTATSKTARATEAEEEGLSLLVSGSHRSKSYRRGTSAPLRSGRRSQDSVQWIGSTICCSAPRGPWR